MKTLALRGINKFGNALTHRQRRFILDRLGVAALVNRFAGDKFEEVLLPNGIRLTISPILHSHLSSNGRLNYEEAVIRVLKRNLRPGDAFYDVGANVGVFAFLAASIVGAGGAVFAFEPEPNNVRCFKLSLQHASVRNIELHDCAVGSEDGAMTFDRRGGAFSGRLVDGGDEPGGHRTFETPVRSIDSLIAGGMPPPKLIKIDVEGGEGLVLEGARSALRQCKPAVLCEMHPDSEDGVRRAFAALADAGYVCRTITGPADRAPEIIHGPLPTPGTYHVLARPA